MGRSLPQLPARRMPSPPPCGFSPRPGDRLRDRFSLGADTMLQVSERVRDAWECTDGGQRAGVPNAAAAGRGTLAHRVSANCLHAWYAIGASGIGVGKGVCAPAERVTLPIRPIHRSFTWADEVTDATYCAVWVPWLLPPGHHPAGTRMGHQLRRNWHMTSMATQHSDGRSKGRLRC